jgi:hypothetical protein
MRGKCDGFCFECELAECPQHPTDETEQWAEMIRRLSSVPDIIILQCDLLKRYEGVIATNGPVGRIGDLCQRLQKINTPEELIERAYALGVQNLALFGPRTEGTR